MDKSAQFTPATAESPASYWNELAADQQSGKAKRCRCGEFNPATYDCCYHCQQPLPDVEQTKVLTERLAELVRDFLDPAPCVLDHHGYCQAHSWLSPGRCPHARAREVLAQYDVELQEAWRP
jgi:hypothetical protein